MHSGRLARLLRFKAHDEKAIENGGDVRRLGRAELGPYAYDNQMPVQLRQKLEHDPSEENETSGLIESLAKLCVQDDSIQFVYLCHSSVHHIAKLRGESPVFCGYRNIQMLVSYILGAKSHGYEHFSHRLPTVLEVQDLIEQAWDHGINTEGREETGGIRGTRKFIGTPEAQALLRYLSIPCRAGVYPPEKDDNGSAFASLLAFVQDYFHTQVNSENDKPQKVQMTNLPPIFLQRPRHSLTIIGFEIRHDKPANLLVFDPAYQIPKEMKRVLGRSETIQEMKSRQATKLLAPYRRGSRQMERYGRFETLCLKI